MNPPTPDLPSKMRAVQVSAFGTPSDVLSISEAQALPHLPTKKGHLLIRVRAVSLTPTDLRIMTGETSLRQTPPHWPYIPCGDVAGVVIQTPPGEARFRAGDAVIATWAGVAHGALAEYAVVKARLAVKLPHGLTFAQGAALANSPVSAMQAVAEGSVGPGDRVLVLGGSGGVGSSVIQLARDAGAAYVAATSTDAALCASLGADRVVNYREENWWEDPDFRRVPFDVVIDCAEGLRAWRGAREHGIVKPAKRGGRFVAVVVYDWKVEIHTWKEMVQWVAPALWRSASNYMNNDTPAYRMLVPPSGGSALRKLVRLAEEARIRPVLDPSGPFEFTEAGVREAFELVRSRGGHGKVVIQVRE